MLIKAEMQAIHDAAAFIRYCQDEQVREATGDFVKGLTDHVYPWATKLAANVDVMLDPTQQESVQRAAMDQVNADAKETWQGVKFVTGTYLSRWPDWPRRPTKAWAMKRSPCSTRATSACRPKPRRA